MGETAPRGNSHVVAPLAFVRGSLCLTSSYHRRKRLRTRSTSTAGPITRTRPRRARGSSRQRRDDVTIGSLSRLTRALDRARRAHAVRKRVDLYLTEFGVQSEPDPISGVSEQRQAEYRSISELIAYRNPRVRAFSQYLMRDDLPRAGSSTQRYGGFESGLRHSGGEAKLAYDGFRLALVAERGRSTRLWGLVRPAGGADDRADRVPQSRLVEVADAQARPHRLPRLLVDEHVRPLGSLLPRALERLHRSADPRLPALIRNSPAGAGLPPVSPNRPGHGPGGRGNQVLGANRRRVPA